MKTTLDLPDELMREAKVRAARSDRKLKDVVAEAIARGLQQTPTNDSQRLDLDHYVGKWPRYKSIDELNVYMDTLRRDRDVAR